MAPNKKTPPSTGKAATKGKPNSKTKPSSSTSTNPTPPAPPKLKPATAINVRHILLPKHSDSLTAVSKLTAGASFDAVAREMSIDKARQGGSLGWKVRGSLIREFEDVAFALEVSTAGKPVWGTVKTGEGWHVVMVEGRR
jgi:peptidyl-prolyl cis-trans isomerase NIMA-interacting 4